MLALLLLSLFGCASPASDAGRYTDVPSYPNSGDTDSSQKNDADEIGHSAEAVARDFVAAAVIAGDTQKYKDCVHPAMQETLASSFDIDLDASSSIVDPGIETAVYGYDTESGEKFEALKDELSREYSIAVDEAMIYEITATWYDYQKAESVNYSWPVRVFYAEGRWYALGWS